QRQGSDVLRSQTLKLIGGASNILSNHVQSVMEALPGEADRDVAARMVRYLVTPSRTKIAPSTADLILYSEAGAEQARSVLQHLADRPEARILRRLDKPERYEIFHDVLAQPLLDWRRDRLATQEHAAIEQKRKEEEDRRLKEFEHQQTVLRADEQ